MFVGAVSDNFDERIDQKIFHAQIVVDNAKVAAETKTYQKIPEDLSFTDANGNDTTKEQVEANYRQIKLDVVEIIEREKERIANDPELRHLVEKEGENCHVLKMVYSYFVSLIYIFHFLSWVL